MVKFKKILNNKVKGFINLIHVKKGIIGDHLNITKGLKWEDLNLSILIFYYYFAHNYNYKRNFNVMSVVLEIRHSYLSNDRWHAL